MDSPTQRLLSGSLYTPVTLRFRSTPRWTTLERFRLAPKPRPSNPTSASEAPKNILQQIEASKPLFHSLTNAGFEVEMISHAEAILRHDMGSAAREIELVLGSLRIPDEELVRGGGGEAQVTQRIRKAFADSGWRKHEFTIQRIIDNVEKECITHQIDHVKTFGAWTVALEIEWNNKDPFFDRDLENFKRLHADGAISVGCIVTRGKSLHDALEGLIERFARRKGVARADQLSEYYDPTPRQKDLIARAGERLGSFEKGWANAFCNDKFGESTTHWRKLHDRISRGVGNPCPLLLIGIPKAVVVED